MMFEVEEELKEYDPGFQNLTRPVEKRRKKISVTLQIDLSNASGWSGVGQSVLLSLTGVAWSMIMLLPRLVRRRNFFIIINNW